MLQFLLYNETNKHDLLSSSIKQKIVQGVYLMALAYSFKLQFLFNYYREEQF
ncbi:hypothetical protein IV72_GL000315 [Atopobium minutum]|nr:hypothetical protein IV72_GL000315 [Atopobium minutum]